MNRAPKARKPAADFARRVVAWQRRHGRHDLPWQGTRDPYAIWLAEIMLQQTQVAAVIPYYLRFRERFPDVPALAAASEDEVMRHWAGLGYYSRARNLHGAARMIATGFEGRFPDTREAIERLPGIGRSTAAAIAAFAFGRREAILDGNVKRVLARHFAIAGFPGKPAVSQVLWALAESLLPARGIERYTQGLMDLGATICTRTNPACHACPVAASCIARLAGRIAEYPKPRPPRVLPQRRTTMLVLIDGSDVLLEKRPAPGIWGGLWCFPEFADAHGASRACEERYGCQVVRSEQLPTVHHGFTHYALDIDPLVVHVRRRPDRVGEPGNLWIDREDARQAALPVPAKRILAALATGQGGLFGEDGAGDGNRTHVLSLGS